MFIAYSPYGLLNTLIINSNGVPRKVCTYPHSNLRDLIANSKEEAIEKCKLTRDIYVQEISFACRIEDSIGEI